MKQSLPSSEQKNFQTLFHKKSRNASSELILNPIGASCVASAMNKFDLMKKSCTNLVFFKLIIAFLILLIRPSEVMGQCEISVTVDIIQIANNCTASNGDAEFFLSDNGDPSCTGSYTLQTIGGASTIAGSPIPGEPEITLGMTYSTGSLGTTNSYKGGLYTFVFTDGNGNVLVDTVLVRVQNGNIGDPLNGECEPACSISASASNVMHESCMDAEDGSFQIDALVSGTAGCSDTLQYSIDGGINYQDENFSSLAPGSYNVIVRCASDTICLANVSVTINESTASCCSADAGTITTLPMEVCADADFSISTSDNNISSDYSQTYFMDSDCNGNIDAVSTSGAFTAPSTPTCDIVVYSFNYLTSDFDPTPGVPEVGDPIPVCPTDGCCSIVSETITVNALPTITSTVDEVCISSMITITVDPAPSGSFSFTSDAPSVAIIDPFTGVVTGISDGMATITYTDDNGCTAEVEVTVYANPTANANASDMEICAGDEIDLLGSAVAGDGIITTYAWTASPVDATIVSPSSMNTTAMPTTGATSTTYTYTLTVTDDNTCSDTDDVMVTVNPAITSFSISSQTNVLCFGDMTGSATTSLIGGTPNYTYNWSNGFNETIASTMSTASGLAAGMYTVMVTDAEGCSAETAVTITQPAAPLSITLASKTDIMCRGDATGEIQIDVSGGTTPSYSYAWTGPGGPYNTEDLTNLVAGEYMLTVMDGNNCEEMITVILTEPNTDVTAAITSSTDISCFGFEDGTATVTPGGGTPPYTFLWSDPMTQTTATATGLDAGVSYTVTVTDDNGCEATDMITLSEPDMELSIELDGDPTAPLCFGEATGSINTTVMGGTGPYTFVWENAIPTIVSVLPDPFGLPADTYTVTVTDANGCTAVLDDPVVLTDPVLLEVSIGSVMDPDCTDPSIGSATATASGGTPNYTYEWSDGVTTTAMISGLTAGLYTVVATDANGCTAVESVLLEDPSALTAHISAKTGVSCYGGSDGSATVTASGGSGDYIYDWDYNGTNAPGVDDGATASGLSAGLHTVTIIDENGTACEVVVSVMISEPSPLTAAITMKSNVSCFDGNDGMAMVFVAGGTPFAPPAAPYTYVWQDAAMNTVSTSDMATGLEAGTYSVTATDDNGCEAVTSVTITGPAMALSASATGSDVSCNGGSDGSIAMNVTGGTLPYSYDWMADIPPSPPGTPDPQDVEDPNGLPAGTYSVEVTDANGCTTTTMATISEPNALSITMITGSDVSCYGDSDGSATVTITGGTSPFNYQWSNGDSENTANLTSSTASTLTAGAYDVTVTDANGCEVVGSVVIGQPDPVAVSLVSKTDLTCNIENATADGSIEIAVTGGTVDPAGDYMFSWVGPSGIFMPADPILPMALEAGNYTVTATDDNGCSATLFVMIMQPTALVADIVSHTDVLCNADPDQENGTAVVNATGGTTPYMYSWSDDGTRTSFMADDLPPGTHTVTVTDANLCATTVTDIEIEEPTAIDIDLNTSNDPSCNGENDGSIFITASGGTGGPYSYNWDNTMDGSEPQDVEDPIGLAGGEYTVTVTDANGCMGTFEVTLTEPEELTVSLTDITHANCNGNATGSATAQVFEGGILGAGPYDYLWSTIPPQITATAINLTAGFYTVIVTDDNGCTAEAGVNINDPTALSAYISEKTAVSCFGDDDGEATVTVSGGSGMYNFTWSGGTVMDTDMDPATSQVIDLSAGLYTVTITEDGNNMCSTVASVMISEPSPLSAFITMKGNNSNCITDPPTPPNGFAMVMGTGGTPEYTYEWRNESDIVVSTGVMANNLAAGDYNVTVTDDNGCEATTSVEITEPEPLAVNLMLTSTTSPSCFGGSDGSIDLEVSGGTPPYSYDWDNAPDVEDPTGLSAGTYNVTVTDANGCTLTHTVTIDPASAMALTVTASPSDAITCHGENDGTATASASGGTMGTGYTYNWSNGNTGETATMLSAGAYTVTATDANGCTAVDHIVITEPAPLTIELDSKTDIDCNEDMNNDMDGSINITVSGRPPGTDFDYEWTGPNSFSSTDEDISGLENGGTYFVTVTDPNGCTATLFAMINEPTLLLAEIISSTDISCNDESDGTATVNATGGTTPYTYNWGGGPSLDPTADNLGPGTHTVTVTDANGCMAEATTNNFINPTEFTVSATEVSGINCSGESDGSATVSIDMGGIAPFSYQWDNGEVTQTALNLNAGMHNVTVTDANGCTALAMVTIGDPPDPLSVTTTGSGADCANNADGEATANPSGGTMPYMYLWSNGEITQTITGLGAGVYTVIVTDANGCTAIGFYTVTDQTALQAYISAKTNVTCYGGMNGSATVAVSGGVAPYTYLWSDGQTTATATNLTAGFHTVRITDSSNGSNCEVYASVMIGEPSPLSAFITMKGDISCNTLPLTEDGFAMVSAAGGTPGYTYLWSPSADNQVAAMAINLPADIMHTVTVTDVNDCTAEVTVTLDQPDMVLSANATGSDVSCNGGNDGSIEMNVTGGTTPYSYDWDNGAQDVEDPNGLPQGTYNVIVTDANGCMTNTMATVGEPDALAIDDISSTPTTCYGDSDGTASVSVMGGTAPYSYQWSSGSTTTGATGLVAGYYDVTVTDNNGCQIVGSVMVGQPEPLAITLIDKTDLSCNPPVMGQDHFGSIDIEVSGGTEPYTYNWNNGGGTMQDPSGLAAGNYTVVVTDDNGCTASMFVMIMQPTQLVAEIVSQTDVLCNGDADGTAVVIVTGGTTPYTYAWPAPSTSTSFMADDLPAGSHTVTITDATTGCSTTATAVIGQPDNALSIGLDGSSNPSCNGESDGSILVTVSGGTEPYFYNWSNGMNVEDPMGLGAGTYDLTVTDANGCSAELAGDVDLTDPDDLTVAITGSTDANCGAGADGTATASAMGGTGAITYQWSNGDMGATATGLSAGYYTVVATDATGCTASVSVNIGDGMALDAHISIIEPLACFGDADGVATVNVFGGSEQYTYEWNTVPVQTTQTATGLSAGQYTVTVTDNLDMACSTVATVILTEPSDLAAFITMKNNVSCNSDPTPDGFAMVSVAGGTPFVNALGETYQYDWDGDGFDDDAMASSLAAGDYTVTVIDANGCTATASVEITEPDALNITELEGIPPLCHDGNDGRIELEVEGGTLAYSYKWNNGAQDVEDPNGLMPGDYGVTITDANGCFVVDEVTVPNVDELTVDASVGDLISCHGDNNGTATATAMGGTGGYTYNWSNGDTGPTADNLSAGAYDVTVTDANGCQVVGSVVLTEPDPLAVALMSKNDIGCHDGDGGIDGAINITVSGGTMAYTYAWTGPGTFTSMDQNLSGLEEAGNYTVVVTDANNCTATLHVTITEPPALAASIISTTDITCHDAADGTATVNVAGGTPGYYYDWGSGNTLNPTAMDLGPGMHTVTITDANGCTLEATTANFINPTEFMVSATKDSDVNCFGENDGSATANAIMGGIAPFTYLWDNGEVSQTAVNLTTGDHNVTVTDANGCTAEATVMGITEPTEPLTVSTTGTGADCATNSTGSATATPAGGTSPYSYQWSNGQTSQTINGLDAGGYTVVVTDANGCTATGFYVVTDATSIEAFISNKENVDCFGGNDGSATVTATGGVAPYSYLWNDPLTQTTATASGLTAGLYTVTVTDNSGGANCEVTVSVMIGEPSPLSAFITMKEHVDCNGGSTGMAMVAVTGGTPNLSGDAYDYDWDGDGFDDGPVASNLAAGNYTVTVMDDNGCTTTASVTIEGPTMVLTIDDITPTSPSCFGGNDGNIELEVSGGTPPYSYDWDNGAQDVEDPNGLPAGTYNVIVTDANGCVTNTMATIDEPDALAIDDISSTPTTCYGDSDGTASVMISGGTMPYSYQWSSGSTTAVASGLSAGSYSFTATDNEGCQIVGSVLVDQPDPLAISLVDKTDLSCNPPVMGQDHFGSIDIEVSGGTEPYTYNWNNGGGTMQDPSGLAAGNYTVVVTDDNGCTASMLVMIMQPTQLVAEIVSQTDVLCNGEADGTAVVIVTGGTTPYTYAWPAPSTSTSFMADDLPAGSHTVTITDATTGCSTTATAVIGQPDNALSIGLDGSSNPSCNGESDGSILVTVSGGTEPYFYNWSNGMNVEDPMGLGAGTYDLTVTDANGCIAELAGDVDLTDPDDLTVAITGSTDANCGAGADGTATASAMGGTGAITYQWSNGDMGATATGLSAGYYTVVATDATGCTASVSVNIGDGMALDATISITEPLECFGDADGEATVFVSGGSDMYSYAWSNTQTTQTATGLSAGQYTVTVTDNLDMACSTTATVTLIQPSDLAAFITMKNHVSCNGENDGSAVVSVAGGTPFVSAFGETYQYDWDGDGFDDGNLAENLAAGNYSVTVMDANGCMATASVEITEPDALNITELEGIPPLCHDGNDGRIELEVEGGTLAYSYKWNNGAQDVEDPNGLMPGDYRVTITDANGCTLVDEVTVPNVDELTVDASVSDLISCHGDNNGTATATAMGGTGGYTYNWSNGDTGPTADNLSAGAYDVTVTDANGCQVVGSVVLTEPDPLAVALMSKNDIGCHDGNGGIDGAINISVSGGTMAYSYEWTGPSVFTSMAQNLSGLEDAGNYTVVVTDANNCTATLHVSITEPPVLEAAIINTTDITCHDAADGTATVNVAGGTPGYYYDWGSGNTLNPTVTNLGPGMYPVTVTDANGCTYEATTGNFVNPTEFTVSATKDSDVNCFGGKRWKCNGQCHHGRYRTLYLPLGQWRGKPNSC